MDSLVVEGTSTASHDREQLAEAVRRISVHGILQRLNDVIVAMPVRLVAIQRSADANDTTCETNANLTFCANVVHQITSNRWLYSFFSTTSFNIL